MSLLTAATPGSNETFVALGLLSAAGAAEKSTAAQYRSRRVRLRQDARAFSSFRHSVAMRFVLAGGRTSKNYFALQEAHREAELEGDMLLFRMRGD